MFRIIIIAVLFFITKTVTAQIEITEGDHDNFALNREVNEKVYYRTKDTNENLKKGDYFIRFKEGNQPLSFWFSIIENGEIDGEINVRMGHTIDDELLWVVHVKNGIVQRSVKYNQNNTSILSKDNYRKGDTIITKYYTKKGVLDSEIKKVGGKEVYKYQCESCTY